MVKYNYQGDIVEIHIRDSSMKLLQFIRFEMNNVKETTKAIWVLKNKYGMKWKEEDEFSNLDLKI